tara:strand:+ start:877 stop:1020 length:144 start_codon:yes stop_codon:yes gene_type:complete
MTTNIGLAFWWHSVNHYKNFREYLKANYRETIKRTKREHIKEYLRGL